jgi:hypothetical protein
MPEEDKALSIEETIAAMQAFENEGQEWMTPVAYAKIRPAWAPQLYRWAKSGVIKLEVCKCGRKVLNVEAVDEVLRQKGKLPPLEGLAAEECIHEGIECEYNTGTDACPCQCTACQNPEVEDESVLHRSSRPED